MKTKITTAFKQIDRKNEIDSIVARVNVLLSASATDNTKFAKITDEFENTISEVLSYFNDDEASE